MEKHPNNRREAPRGTDIIAGRNAVTEALKAGRAIDSLYVQRGERPGGLQALIAKAKEAGAAIKEANPKKLEHLCGGANHQGVVAVAAVKEYATVENLFQRAQERGEPPFFVICDELEDPHNLGAVIRTAECAGAHGVIVPKRRSVGLTYAVGNMDGAPWCQTDFTGPVALVIGSEGKGVGRLVKEKADFVVSLPLKGNINSLNASVAAGILCYEVSRQRSGLKAVNP